MSNNFDNLETRTRVLMLSFEKELINVLVERLKQNVIVEELDPIFSNIRETRFDTIQDLYNKGHIDDIDNLSFEDLLNASYLKQKLDILLLINPEKDVTKFCKYAEDNGLYEIRNFVAHPKTIFPKEYWYQLCAILLRPVLSRIVPALKKILIDTENDSLKEGPEEWYVDLGFEIPNNLISKMNHDVTGFVGRKIQRNDLTKFIKSEHLRSIAVVSAGGFGKTALVNQVLNDVKNDLNYRNKLDAILQYSLKEKELDYEGIEHTVDADSFDEIEFSYIESRIISDIKVLLGSNINCASESKIIVFIDNLESLSNNDYKKFTDILLEFPPQYKFIVTSRKSVDGFKTLTLSSMSEKESYQLAVRSYLAFNVVKDIKEDVINTITKKLANNPLAIKICMYSLSRSVDLKSSIEKSSKNIINFSYESVVESLTPCESKILDALFVIHKADSIALSDYLDEPESEIEYYLHELLKPSLIRDDSVSNALIESSRIFYKLDDMFKIFLSKSELVNGFRSLVLDRMKDRKIKAEKIQAQQEDLSIERLHPNYMSPEVPLVLREKVNSLFNENKNATSVGENFSVINKNIGLKYVDFFNENVESCGSFQIFRRVFGLICRSLDDNYGFVKHLSMAIKLEPENINNYITLAEYYLKENEFNESLGVLNEVKDSDFFNSFKTLDESSTLILHGLYFKNLMRVKDWGRLNEFTEMWTLYHKKQQVCVLVAYRIKYLVSYMRENRDNFRYNFAIDIFKEAIDIFNTLIDKVLVKRYKVGGFGISVPEYNLGRQTTLFFETEGANLIKCFLSFVDNAKKVISESEFNEILNSLKYFIKNNTYLPLDCSYNCKKELIDLSLIDNPFSEFSSEIEDSPEFLGANSHIVNHSEIKELGLTEVEISSFPRSYKGKFYFSGTSNGNLIEGFAHKRFFKSSSQREWISLKVGETVAIRYEDDYHDSSRKFATEIYKIYSK
jgi:tetratricopeptide (TPR) repeat protein